MKKILLVLILLMTMIFTVQAEEQIDLSTPGADALSPIVLPDGRVIFAGNVSERGNEQNRKARLLCLNSDGTVAWEYLHPAKGKCSFNHVQLLPNNQLGAVFSNEPNQIYTEAAIYKFSLDGEQSSNPIDIFAVDMLLNTATDTCIVYSVSLPDGSFRYHFVDWDGNQLFQLQSNTIIGGGFQTLPAENGVLLVGNEPGFPALGKIVRLDLKGNVVWSQTLEPTLSDANRMGFQPISL